MYASTILRTVFQKDFSYSTVVFDLVKSNILNLSAKMQNTCLWL